MLCEWAMTGLDASLLVAGSRGGLGSHDLDDVDGDRALYFDGIGDTGRLIHVLGSR